MTDLKVSLHTKNPAWLYALYLYTSALSRRVHYTTLGKFSLLILQPKFYSPFIPSRILISEARKGKEDSSGWPIDS